ncbi:MAG: DUF2520 domain-containing protein [Legionellaceae bacterium]|nr:DUF2520 domain-containing protein [Legionellaceae bacterium]
MMILNIIGAGHVGQTLGHLFVKHQLVSVGGIYNRTRESAMDAIRFIGQGSYCATIAELPHADITLITTPDDCIAKTCSSLALNRHIHAGDIVMHCSGALSSDCLFSMKERGGLVASVHPMRSFKQPAISVQEYIGTYCAMEGDEQALAVLGSLFEAIGSKTHIIKKDKKTLYHAAAVFASNYLITLSQQALECLNEAGIEHDIAMPLIVGIMQSTLTNLTILQSPKQALTGPVQRKDLATIERHRAAFTNIQQRELYEKLMEATKNIVD